jgi:3-deoxy-D-manno-octulosonic-acid transferase
VDLFCMQSEDDAERIRTIGAADRVLVTGNLKFDQKLENRRAPVAIPKARKVITAGARIAAKKRRFSGCSRD